MIPMIPVSKNAVANRRLYLTNRAELIDFSDGDVLSRISLNEGLPKSVRFRRTLSAAEQTPCACTRHPCRTAPPHIRFRFPIASRNRFPCKRPRR